MNKENLQLVTYFQKNVSANKSAKFQLIINKFFQEIVKTFLVIGKTIKAYNLGQLKLLSL